MAGVFMKDRVERGEGSIEVPENILKGALGALNIVYDRRLFFSLLGKADTIFVCLKTLFEIMGLKEFGSLYFQKTYLIQFL